MIKITAADRYFSLCVRKRAGWACERCGARHAPPTGALHCAHIMGRSSWSTRIDPDNAVSLCMGCHLYFTGRPAEFMRWIESRVGLHNLERLRMLSRIPARGLKRRVREIARHYRNEYDRMALGGEFEGWAG